ncbi:HNH endonuclease signature motif containing protein [Microbacterium testaceum]|uniref:HNH endonuclease signature motif containing protein n=1 Tax=Microbacterium testaceum TaxID=2033 RepID=UPI002434CBF5|nr:HNH endonuclease signature motif containing protein [Microbacterium testaceum]
MAPDAPRTFRSAPPAAVIVTVPALTLLGHDAEPATLEGYGPIDLDTARRLAGTARSWIRLLTHPVTGAPLVLDRRTYRVPVALRRWLGITSPICVFPGCARAARDCDIDHLTAWADGGTTDDDNLDPECRHHHRVRHESRWDIDDHPDGDTAWISPLGGTYNTDPPPF